MQVATRKSETMGNAIQNSIYNIFRETQQRRNNIQLPQTPCPRCGALMRLNPIGDGRMGQWHCQRCKYKQIVQLG
jgi:ribosomal protein S27AE